MHFAILAGNYTNIEACSRPSAWDPLLTKGFNIVLGEFRESQLFLTGLHRQYNLKIGA